MRREYAMRVRELGLSRWFSLVTVIDISVLGHVIIIFAEVSFANSGFRSEECSRWVWHNRVSGCTVRMGYRIAMMLQYALPCRNRR